MRFEFQVDGGRFEVNRSVKSAGDARRVGVESLHWCAHRCHPGHVVSQGAVKAEVGGALSLGIRFAQKVQCQLGFTGPSGADHADDARGHVDARYPNGQASGQSGGGLLQPSSQR